ncbi:Hypothetical_protein [Hexamita inflata]|uniref:Hypothetical_protein n=1 Tax=Hexamita inflata TaxID=28002 RepID=A0AA86NWY4_9EUKA|nr:Hypothetical protein HINF_LOCUS15034 [Hexamita inflata]
MFSVSALNLNHSKELFASEQERVEREFFTNQIKLELVYYLLIEFSVQDQFQVKQGFYQLEIVLKTIWSEQTSLQIKKLVHNTLVVINTNIIKWHTHIFPN